MIPKILCRLTFRSAFCLVCPLCSIHAGISSRYTKIILKSITFHPFTFLMLHSSRGIKSNFHKNTLYCPIEDHTLYLSFYNNIILKTVLEFRIRLFRILSDAWSNTCGGAAFGGFLVLSTDCSFSSKLKHSVTSHRFRSYGDFATSTQTYGNTWTPGC